MGICTYDDTMEDDEEVEEAEYSAIPVTPETGLSVVNGHYEDPSGGC